MPNSTSQGTGRARRWTSMCWPDRWRRCLILLTLSKPCGMAIDRLVVVVAVEDEAVPALGDDVEDIGRPDLEVLRASEAKKCDLLIENRGRVGEGRENWHKGF